jgi:hypothetical protein
MSVAQLSELALVAVASCLGVDAEPHRGAEASAAIAGTFAPYFAPPPATDTGQPRTPFYVLVRNTVRQAGFGQRRNPRWTHVVSLLAVGSTFARELCVWAGVDPDELIGDYR